MKNYIKQMRIKHYLKNVLIFLPLVFSGNLLSLSKFSQTFIGFIAFCMLASAIYTINDIYDVEKDKKHSSKCNRPIASGKIPIKKAWIFVAILLAITIILNFLASKSIISILYLLVYLILNIFYSNGAKNIPLVDIIILVSGFIIRVLYGSSILDIEISKWLYLTIMSMSFYLGFGKRRNEILRQKENSKETRTVLKYYTHEFLDKNMYMCLSLTIVFYSLWCIDTNTLNNLSSDVLIWTVPIIMLICMKYSLIIENNSDGDPVEVVFSSKFLLLLIMLYGLTMFAIVYGKFII